MTGHGEIESILQYEFRDHALLDEALVASGARPSTSRNDARKHGNKCLALIGDTLLRLVIVDDGIIGGASTGKIMAPYGTFFIIEDISKMSAHLCCRSIKFRPARNSENG